MIRWKVFLITERNRPTDNRWPCVCTLLPNSADSKYLTAATFLGRALESWEGGRCSVMLHIPAFHLWPPDTAIGLARKDSLTIKIPIWPWLGSLAHTSGLVTVTKYLIINQNIHLDFLPKKPKASFSFLLGYCYYCSAGNGQKLMLTTIQMLPW